MMMIMSMMLMWMMMMMNKERKNRNGKKKALALYHMPGREWTYSITGSYIKILWIGLKNAIERSPVGEIGKK